MTRRDMFEAAAWSAVRAGERQGGTVMRIKCESAKRVIVRVMNGTIPLTDAQLAATVDRIYRATGTADRSVAQSELEVIIGLGIGA